MSIVNKRKGIMKRLASIIGASVVSLGLAHSSFGALVEGTPLVNFMPVPTTAEPEVIWTNGGAPGLKEGAGSVSNAAGRDALAIAVPIDITSAGCADHEVANGQSVCYDVTLDIENMNAGNLPALGSVIIQDIVGGPNAPMTFSLTTDKTGGGTVVLLTGTITTPAQLWSYTGSRVGWVNGTVEYTGGVLYDKLVEAGTTDFTADFSWSLLDIVDSGSGTNGIQLSGGKVAPFVANMTGLFGTPAIPEPASTALLGLGAIGLLRRRRA